MISYRCTKYRHLKVSHMQPHFPRCQQSAQVKAKSANHESAHDSKGQKKGDVIRNGEMSPTTTRSEGNKTRFRNEQ
jgi:hypothetical protein